MPVGTLFKVVADTSEDEIVCVTGDTPLLGNWLPAAGIPLVKEASTDGATESNTWSRVIDLPGNANYQFRYYVCRFLEDGNGEKKLIVCRWESNLLPRTISTKNGHPEPNGTAEFGNYVGSKIISNGWLMGQTDTQIRLHNNPIYMWKRRHRAQTYRIKCVPMDYTMRDPSDTVIESYNGDEEESREGLPPCNKTLVKYFSLRDDDPVPKEQGQFGPVYKNNDFLVFQSQSFFPENLGYQVDFYVEEPSRHPRYVGHAYILPINQSESIGNRKVPIMGLKHKPIGELSIEYFLTQPYKHHTFDLEMSYQNHWKRLGRSLDVGHRGMGESYKRLALVRENTIASLSSAGIHGADFVEFDVMLSKDLKPVVYHDYWVSLLHRKRDQVREDLLEISVKDLTCDQLQSLRLYHASSSAEHQITLTGEHSDNDDLQPFPTLQQCLERVPPEIGFNIEVKYPMQTESGWELEHYFDHNKSMDIILKTVFDYAGSRRIIFSSFDPNTCIMMQLKQNRYPVLFLNMGPTSKYDPYMDCRAQEFEIGMKFALAHGLLGVDYFCEGLLQDLSIIQKVQDAGLVMFVWGDDTNNAENIQLLRKHGVDGIIYDRIDFYKSEPGKQFVFSKENEEELLNAAI